MKKLISIFKLLSRDQILAFPAGIYGDFELLSVCEYFENVNTCDRELAVYELILHSPEVRETGIANAISLLKMVWDKFSKGFDFLSLWLNQAQGNWRAELLSSKMGKISEDITQALQVYARNTRKDNNFRSATTAALVERAQYLPSQYGEVVIFIMN